MASSRPPSPFTPLLVVGLTLLAAPTLARAQEAPSTEWQIAAAVLAAPEQHRDGAEVRAWNEAGELVTLRPRTNNLICLADRPGDGRFAAACYHASLEPFMARGRELTAEGVEGPERQQIRWKEARAGTLRVPDQPAMVYNLGFPTEDFDPATVDVATGSRLHAIYVPYATPESTGLPTSPAGGGPWLMFPGEPSAHIMVALLPSSGG